MQQLMEKLKLIVGKKVELVIVLMTVEQSFIWNNFTVPIIGDGTGGTAIVY